MQALSQPSGDFLFRIRERNPAQIVPVECFLSAIRKATGWSADVLKTKDMGDIERRLNLNHFYGSDNILNQGLYTWMGPYQRARAKEVIDRLLEQDSKELGPVRALLRF
jgi:hypothetical protein